MSIEIERKFLVSGGAWRSQAGGCVRIRQGYLGVEGGFTVRVRVIDEADATLTLKSGGPSLKRLEFEYPIPLADAQSLLATRQGGVILKTRHIVPWHGRRWELDVFEEENEGLVIAEIELAHEADTCDLPPWIGAEVTGDARYYNSSLARHPYGRWQDSRQLPRNHGDRHTSS